MKFLITMSLLATTLSCHAAPTASKKSLPVKQEVKNAVGKKEEDCDAKAKKPIEIKEETISLTGNTGCSLDEAKP